MAHNRGIGNSVGCAIVSVAVDRDSTARCSLGAWLDFSSILCFANAAFYAVINSRNHGQPVFIRVLFRDFATTPNSRCNRADNSSANLEIGVTVYPFDCMGVCQLDFYTGDLGIVQS
mgnify:CR=1 FL=1